MKRSWTTYFAVLAVACLPYRVCGAAEVHSNGEGGGLWSDPATWHGRKVPGSGDNVVVAMRDVVIFDRDDTGGPTCERIDIDPEGVLTFKTGPGRRTLTVNRWIESYGIIKLDGTDASTGSLELRLGSKEKDQGKIILLQNAAFLAYGKKGSEDTPGNVRISAWDPGTSNSQQTVTITANGAAMIDLQHTAVTNVVVQATAIDNTGNKGNERLNIIGNQFTGLSRIALTHCDTPVIRNNVFKLGDTKASVETISIDACKLAEIAGNTVRGKYTYGIKVSRDTDSSLTGNIIEDCTVQGIYWHGNNAMIKRNRLSRCRLGVHATSSSGVIEHVTVSESGTAFAVTSSTMQLTDCRVENVSEGGVPLSLNSASVILLNCNIADDQITLAGKAPGETFVESMQYLVVRVKRNRPEGARVELRTAKVSGGVPKKRADLNVRNSPAKLDVDGFTPLPASMKPLIVRSWQIQKNKKIVNAPFYDLLVTVPQSGKPPKTIKTQLVEPDDSWFRSEPNERTPTLEVTLP